MGDVKTIISSKYNPNFKYEVQRIIGEGTYGKVYEVLNSNGEKFAIKKFKDGMGEPHETTVNECAILKSLNHQNIIKPIDIAVEDYSCMILMNLMDGDLSKLMRKEAVAQASIENRKKIKPTGLSGDLIKSIMKQALEGILYMHERKVFHRDIKPQNILYHEMPDGHIQIKYADLGLAKLFAPTVGAKFSYGESVQTLWYRCPEILLGVQMYQPAIDMWSLGCLMIELATGYPLFPGDCAFDQIRLIFQLLGTPDEMIWPGCTTELKYYGSLFPRWECNKGLIDATCLPKLGIWGVDLLMKLLSYDPHTRITPQDALKHPWITMK